MVAAYLGCVTRRRPRAVVRGVRRCVTVAVILSILPTRTQVVCPLVAPGRERDVVLELCAMA